MGDLTDLEKLICKIAKRAKALADMPIDELRSEAGYGMASRAEAIRTLREQGKTRGQMVETCLNEEFIQYKQGE